MLCGFYSRLHDLLIEKAELQESLESVKIEFEERMKSLEENDYLSELVGSTVLQSLIMNDVVSEQIKDDDMINFTIFRFMQGRSNLKMMKMLTK